MGFEAIPGLAASFSDPPAHSASISPLSIIPSVAFPAYCAHRGFKTVAPENTLGAFGAAIALGAPEIELDVRFTRDGVPVVCHDDRLDRVANGSGLVQDLTFAELRELDAGIKFSSHFAGTKIPAFEEVLSKFARHAIINLHIKSEGGSAGNTYSAEHFRRIVELLKTYDQMEHVYLMATSEIMKVALDVAPEIPRCMSADEFGYPTSTAAWKIVERAIEWKCCKVQLFKPYFDREMIEKAHANGIRCNVFWSDDPAESSQFFDMGVDTILTNDYLAIEQVRAARGIPR